MKTLYCNLPTNKDTPKPSEEPDRGDPGKSQLSFLRLESCIRRVLGQAQVLELLAMGYNPDCFNCVDCSRRALKEPPFTNGGSWASLQDAICKHVIFMLV